MLFTGLFLMLVMHTVVQHAAVPVWGDKKSFPFPNPGRPFEVFDLSHISDWAMPDVRHCGTEGWKANAQTNSWA